MKTVVARQSTFRSIPGAIIPQQEVVHGTNVFAFG